MCNPILWPNFPLQHDDGKRWSEDKKLLEKPLFIIKLFALILFVICHDRNCLTLNTVVIVKTSESPLEVLLSWIRTSWKNNEKTVRKNWVSSRLHTNSLPVEKLIHLRFNCFIIDVMKVSFDICNLLRYHMLFYRPW